MQSRGRAGEKTIREDDDDDDDDEIDVEHSLRASKQKKTERDAEQRNDDVVGDECNKEQDSVCRRL